ncbi:three-Cys-motif partner protein TcmP [Patescibacteria group bacterium]|nr:three-Cys-motif partner protein TcmP [Patescibacteria group bacterium]
MKPIEFFKSKKSWSRMKDKILGCYLVPYINKVKQFKKAVVIIDGFAGCGIYGDKSEGSPIIICKILESYNKKGIKAIGIFIDSDPGCFKELEKNIKYFKDKGIAITEFADFREIVPEIIKVAENSPTFFYIDPFGIAGLEFRHLENIFEKVNRSSTEVLVNFNYRVFYREIKAHPELVRDVMDGEYYKEILKDKTLSNDQKEKKILEKYKDLYRKYFNFVGSCPVMYKDEQDAKYHLIFATSHFDGLRLMNDIMGNVYREFYTKGRLFDTTPPEKRRDLKSLRETVINLMREIGITNRENIKKILVPKSFMRYKEGDYNTLISKLIKARKVYSKTGRSRINDQTPISLTKFPQEPKK